MRIVLDLGVRPIEVLVVAVLPGPVFARSTCGGGAGTLALGSRPRPSARRPCVGVRQCNGLRRGGGLFSDQAASSRFRFRPCRGSHAAPVFADLLRRPALGLLNGGRGCRVGRPPTGRETAARVSNTGNRVRTCVWTWCPAVCIPTPKGVAYVVETGFDRGRGREAGGAVRPAIAGWLPRGRCRAAWLRRRRPITIGAPAVGPPPPARPRASMIAGAGLVDRPDGRGWSCSTPSSWWVKASAPRPTFMRDPLPVARRPEEDGLEFCPPLAPVPAPSPAANPPPSASVPDRRSVDVLEAGGALRSRPGRQSAGRTRDAVAAGRGRRGEPSGKKRPGAGRGRGPAVFFFRSRGRQGSVRTGGSSQSFFPKARRRALDFQERRIVVEIAVGDNGGCAYMLPATVLFCDDDGCSEATRREAGVPCCAGKSQGGRP